MSFNDDFAEVGAPSLMASLGETVSLQLVGRVAADVSAIVEEEESRRDEQADGAVMIRTIRVKFLRTDLERAPGRGDKLTFDGATWGYDQRISNRHGFYAASWTRTEPVDKTREGRRVRP